MDQPGGATPILVAGVGEEDLGHRPGVGQHAQQPVLQTGHRVLLCAADEREDVGRVEKRRVGMGVAGGLTKAVVEAAAARAGGLGQHPVQRRPTLEVLVEPLVEKVAKKASRLRDTHGESPLPRRRAPRAVLEKRHQVPHHRQPETHHRGVPGHVDRLVDLSRLEALRQMDVGAVRHDPPGLVEPGETPPRAWNHPSLAESRVTHGEHVAGIARVRHRVGAMVPMGQGQHLCRLGEDVVGADQPLDRLASGPLARGDEDRVEPEELGPIRDVPLPGGPNDGEAPPHQKAVAEIVECRGIGGAASVPIEVEDRGLAAAVGDLHQQRPVALLRLHRLEDVNVSGEAHLLLFVAGRQIEVDDAGVAGVVRIQAIADFPHQLFVATGEPEGVAPGHHLAAGDVDAHHLGGGGSRPSEGEKGEKDSERGDGTRDSKTHEGSPLPARSAPPAPGRGCRRRRPAAGLARAPRHTAC